jgi:two-component system, OmpR family, sensor kinase
VAAIVSDGVSEADVIPDPPGRRRREALTRLSDRTPLRTKLIAAVLALVCLALAAISVASTYMLRQSLITQHDPGIQSVIRYFNATNRLPTQRVEPGYAAPTPTNIVVGFQVPGSQLTWGQFNLPGISSQDPLPLLPSNGLWTAKNGNPSPIQSVPAQSGPNTWRVMAETVKLTDPITGQSTNVILVVAVDLGNVHALTLRLVVFDLIVSVLIVLVLAAVGVALIRANLRPLNDIELTAGQIAAGHLNHRVPERDPRTEVGSLGRSLNTMLEQIETAFHAQQESEQAAHESEERMRRFVGDASHELRTPLTTIRGFAAHYRQRGGVRGDTAGGDSASAATERVTLSNESGQSRFAGTSAASPESSAWAPAGVATATGMSPQDVDHLMARVESEATRMGLLVEDLLTLARLDQARPLTVGPVDLLTLAVDSVHDARIVAPGRPIDLIVAPGAAFLVNGDEARLRQVLSNLVNNALTHTPAGTAVRVRIGPGTLMTRGGGGTTVPAVVLDVEDDGPGMPPEQAQRVFERFFRADAARNRSSGGTGLGLAIVAGLVSAHGGTVSLRTAPGTGANFQVKLPLAPDAQLAEPDEEDV